MSFFESNLEPKTPSSNSFTNRKDISIYPIYKYFL